MKIIWINNISYEMPHKTSRIKMAEALRKKGHKITLFMAKRFGEKRKKSTYQEYIPTINIPMISGIIFGLMVFFYLPITLRKKRFDIIIIDATKIPTPFLIPLKIFNAPIILDIRTLPIDREISKIFQYSILFSRYIIDGITTISNELYKTLQNKYNLKTEHYGIWSSGVSIEDFNQKQSTNKNRNKEILRLIYHGNYSPTRGIENLIISLSKLDPTTKEHVKLSIIGMPAKIKNNLEKLCQEIGLENNIKIKPRISYDKISKELTNSDIGIIPLPPEKKWWQVSVPLKTLEYLAAYKPIIATDIPFHKEIFQKGDCGILVHSAEPEILSKAITQIYRKKNNLNEIGKVGRRIVEQHYTWEKISNNLESYLSEVIDSKKK